MSLTNEELRTVQLRSLEVYKNFECFCLAHGLRLYVCGGALIGALRSGGFIPWDDDIDVFMPRGDYDRLWALWQAEGDKTRYQLVQPGHGVCYGGQMSYLYDLSAPCVREEPKPNVPSCLCMDILPLDGWPEGRAARLFQLFWANLFGLYIVGRLPENHGGAVKTGCALLLALAPTEAARAKLARLAQRKMSRYLPKDCPAWTELCSGWKYIGKRYPASVFAEPRAIPFEGTTILAPTDADTYLKTAFGDYRTLPPKVQQIPAHGLASIGFGGEGKEQP